MTPPRIILVATALLIALVAIGLGDYTRTQTSKDNARESAERSNAADPCEEPDLPSLLTLEENRRYEREQEAYEECLADDLLVDPDEGAERVERGWNRRKPWYVFAAGATVLLAAAAAYAGRGTYRKTS